MPNINITLQLNEVVQKANESPSDCQDAYSYNETLNRYAIADGISQSFFPAEWAKLLVNHFCNDTSPLNTQIFQNQKWREWLIPIQQRWFKEIKERVEQKKGHNSIHLRNSLAQKEPAAATFIGLQIDTTSNEGEGRWQSMIIGDSCLFHVRGDQFNSYPITHPSDFNYHPQYFASNDSINKYEPEFISGTIIEGDILILTTDAFAKWILTKRLAGNEVCQDTLEKLLELSKWDDLYQFVEEARHGNETPLEDDDVAIVIISTFEKNDIRTRGLSEPVTNLESTRPTSTFVSSPSAGMAPTIMSQEHILTTRDEYDSWIRRMRSPQSLSTIALCLGGISLIISLLNSYKLYIRQPDATPPVASSTPVVSADTTNDSKPSTPTTDLINLSSGTVVYSAPDNQSNKVLLIENQYQAKIIPDSETGAVKWKKIRMELWIRVVKRDIREDDNKITIKRTVIARSNGNFTDAQVGKFVANAVLQKIQESIDSRQNRWYQVRVEGYSDIP